MPLCVVDNHLCVYVPFACLRNQQPHSKGGFRGTAGNASERFSHLPTALRLCCHLLDAGRYCRHCPSKGVPGVFQAPETCSGFSWGSSVFSRLL